MKPWALFTILLASLACQLAGLAMFAKGFFPYKAISTSFASLEDIPPLPFFPSYGQPEEEVQVRPIFGKVVLMLVDALRSLIDSNKAIPFTAIASAPTVTLPRLKALTTGTVPGFLDAILNIAESDQSSTLANQDNWIAQFAMSPSKRLNAKRTGGTVEKRKIGFFGDDTWIKLFPGLFSWTDGTSSFFAMDTVEVDNNVTRHVEPELTRDDWDGLIFHYLGLDHVGHSGGPKSALMRPKQAEMDSVAETIYKALVAKDSITSTDQERELPTLFILCGDHGMNEVGNHGGSSRSEISTSFVFMSPVFEHKGNMDKIQAMIDPYRQDVQTEREEYEYYKSVSQVDLVPTLSLLMGLPIPKNSVGKLIPELFSDSRGEEKLKALQINSYQVAGVLRNMWSDFEVESSVLLKGYKFRDWAPGEEEREIEYKGEYRGLLRCSAEKSQKQVLSCLYSLALAEHASYVELSDSFCALGDTSRILDSRFRTAKSAYLKFLEEASSMLSTALSKYDMPLLTNGSLMMAFAVAGFLYCAIQTSMLDDFKRSCLEPPASRTLKRSKNDVDWTGARVLSVVILILYLVTLFASSFVEEEHQFWYFFNMTWWAVLGLTSARYLVNTINFNTAEPAFKPNGSDKFQKHKYSTSSAVATGYCLFQMAILRLLRSWNQTGQKYADQIDLRHYLNSSWVGVSWVLFWTTVTIVAASMIVQIYVIHSPLAKKYIPVWKAGLISVFQAWLSILVILVSLWITIYKMDLESSYFGDATMARIHGFMSTLSSIGYSNMGANGTLVMSGYEMARGCYAGLGAMVLLILGLKVISNSSSRQADSDPMAKIDLQSRTRILFGPSMLLGTTTLLLILLSRRHNAPLFLLFSLQLNLYINWITLVRQRESVADGAVYSQEAEKLDKTFVSSEDDNDTENHTKTSESIPLQASFRTLPGQSSIHSCTIILWTLSSFFLMGNSNSIASIDISNAYVGIQAYDIVLTGVLTFVSNWAGPIWWCVGAVMVMRWDLELELAWSKQDKVLRLKEEEERSWKTISGWKREDKSTLTRKTKRRMWLYKQAVVKSREAAAAAVAAEKNIQEIEIKSDESGLQHESPLPLNQGEQDNVHELNTSAIGSGETLLSDQQNDDAFYVYEEQEFLVTEGGSSTLPLDIPCVLSSPREFRQHLIKTRVLDHLILTSIFFGMTLYVLSIAAIILRHHLFIWTVFSPKVLYQFAWTVSFQIIVQVLVIGCGVWTVLEAPF
ncbi:major facilitator super transporter protein [Mortierella sp. AD011]|nr:major facilitator super transporter protein [Mortierella sp. AD010]KAF9395700.1 major facilitator super transporter protein [Mortierella sp. AD011]